MQERPTGVASVGEAATATIDYSAQYSRTTDSNRSNRSGF
jgi:hypothetical protein